MLVSLQELSRYGTSLPESGLNRGQGCVRSWFDFMIFVEKTGADGGWHYEKINVD